MEKDLLVGKIVGVHGVRGNLKVSAYAESLAVLEPGSLVYIDCKDGNRAVHTVVGAKPHKRIVLLSLETVTDVDRARELIGGEIRVDQGLLPDLDEGTYYWKDIIGLSVYAKDQRYLGRVESIIPTGGNDVFVVRRDGEEILVPALESVVLDVDIEGRTMQIDLPEGLE